MGRAGVIFELSKAVQRLVEPNHSGTVPPHTLRQVLYVKKPEKSEKEKREMRRWNDGGGGDFYQS